MSSSSFLRELIHDDTSRPTMAEVLKGITARDSIEADPADRREGAGLRARFELQRYVHAPALIDAEVASATRGLLDLPLHRYPMQPHQRQVLTRPSICPSQASPARQVERARTCARSPCWPKRINSSTGLPLADPSAWGRWVSNSAASPGRSVRSFSPSTSRSRPLST